ncbi:MAG: ATP-binding protein [Bacteroidetes bacterium]|nr:ATP-binding protein [Bacteroidota bacterium]
MIDKENLIKLIENDENPKVEFKRSEYVKGQKNCELAKTMAGFANHKGGKILIGVKDDRTIEGFSCNEPEVKKYEEKVYQIAAHNCNPPITPEFSSVKLNEGMIFIIDIPENGDPVRACGKFYIRHGNITRELTHEELQRKYTNLEMKETFNEPPINSVDKLSEEQFEVCDIIHEGKVIPYIEFEATEHSECVLYSKIYNNYFEKAYYVEASFNDVTIDKLKEILVTYYTTFVNYSHYNSVFNISASGLSWVGYSPNNFVEALQNQNFRYSQIKKKFGDEVYIHHREAACFIDEIDGTIFYIHAQPNKSSNVNELTLDYFNVGFIFSNIPFNQIYNEFFKEIKYVPESLEEVNGGLTQTFPLKNITFSEEGFIATKHGDENYILGLYGKIPQQLKKNTIVNRHDKIIVNLKDYHEINQIHNYSIYNVKVTQIPSGSFPAYILDFGGNW